MPYGQLIKEAFRIARGHRYLWPFGIFAGTSFNFNFNVVSDGSGGLPEIDPGVLVAIGLTALLLFVLFAALGVISHGAMPQAVAAIWRGERPGFRATFRLGRATFWRVLGLGALVFAIVIGLLAVVAIPLALVVLVTFGSTDATLPRALSVVGAGLGAVALLVIAFMPLLVIGQHAVRELVLAGRGIVESLRGGWALLRAHLGTSILLLLIQQGLAIAALLALGLATGIVAVPMIVIAVVTGGTAAVIIAIVGAVVLLPVVLTAVGAVGAFTHTFWTLAYMRLTWGANPHSE